MENYTAINMNSLSLPKDSEVVYKMLTNVNIIKISDQMY